MRKVAMAGALGVLAFAADARANTFMIDYENRSAVDPAADFEADCLGATEQPSCVSRAAALSAELADLLGTLEGRRDAETMVLFEQAVALGDPKLAEIGVRYFANRSQVPDGVWTRVKEFFFGADPGLGAASADLLEQSADDVQVALAEHYLEGHQAYGAGVPAAGVDDAWAQRQAGDALLEAMLAFEESEQFTPASRLLMNDRVVSDYRDPEGGFPVTAFVTDSPVADVTQFFIKLFGKQPYPSLAETELELEKINQEIEALSLKLQQGDFSAASRMTELAKQLTPMQEAASLAQVYEIEDQKCTDHVFWVDGTAENAYLGKLPRAVVLGKDALIGRTAIRYISGLGKSARPNGGGADGGVGDEDDDDDSGSADGGVRDPDDGHAPTLGKKSGGGCSVANSAAPNLWLALLGVALLSAFGLRRRTKVFLKP